jgi:FKBP-type peptidyl-prolyl cis-trans isomerase 2
MMMMIPLHCGVGFARQVKLSSGLNARVVSVDEVSVRIDANPPYAGQTLLMDVEVLRSEELAFAPNGPFERAHLAAGCFWG